MNGKDKALIASRATKFLQELGWLPSDLKPPQKLNLLVHAISARYKGEDGWLIPKKRRDRWEFLKKFLLIYKVDLTRRERSKPSPAPTKYRPRKKQTYKIHPNSDEFLSSYEWRKVRMIVLKRDGARCACCNATRESGLQMHVDHIKPRKIYPELALDPTNLQVLCEVCNHGKGNWDMTDWRAKETT